MDKIEKMRKMRLIQKFMFDYVIAIDEIYGIIDTQQELSKVVHELMKDAIKSDRQINKLYRSAKRHLSFKAYQEALV